MQKQLPVPSPLAAPLGLVPYSWRVRCLKNRYGNAAQRRWWSLRGRPVRPALAWMDEFAPGRRVVDVGGMWGINGSHSFRAEQASAESVTLVDVTRTEAFDREHALRDSSVRFIQGDISSPEVLEAIGDADLVWCWGVLYHHPNPAQLVEHLREICSEILILESFTALEVAGLPQAAVYFPYMDARHRGVWDTTKRGGAGVQFAISTDYDSSVGYSNNFWALSPTGVAGVLRTCGFTVDGFAPSPSGALRHVFIARATNPSGLPG